jgi:hypothetical protein
MGKIWILITMILFLGVEVFALESKQKTQKIDFEEETIDGQARKPDGSYVVQKRSVDFVPLYRVREHFDENIKQSIEYLK